MSRRGQVVAGIALALTLGCTGDAAPQPAAALQVDREARRVSLPATLHLAAFAAGDPPGHHLVTWEGGRAGAKALLSCAASDSQVLDALESLGATPGDTLSEAAWTYRDDPARPEPDQRATGAPLDVSVTLPDGRELPIAALLEDLDGKGTTWVLAGNRALIEVWRSGCVVCLQSCPGSKVANRDATIRDLARGEARFAASDLARGLGEGAEVVVHFTLAE